VAVTLDSCNRYIRQGDLSMLNSALDDAAAHFDAALGIGNPALLAFPHNLRLKRVRAPPRLGLAPLIAVRYVRVYLLRILCLCVSRVADGIVQLMGALHARKCVAISSRAVSAGSESSRPFYQKALVEAFQSVQLCPDWSQAHLLQVTL
jgi:hypothetical protein